MKSSTLKKQYKFGKNNALNYVDNQIVHKKMYKSKSKGWLIAMSSALVLGGYLMVGNVNVHADTTTSDNGATSSAASDTGQSTLNSSQVVTKPTSGQSSVTDMFIDSTNNTQSSVSQVVNSVDSQTSQSSTETTGSSAISSQSSATSNVASSSLNSSTSSNIQSNSSVSGIKASLASTSNSVQSSDISTNSSALSSNSDSVITSTDSKVDSSSVTSSIANSLTSSNASDIDSSTTSVSQIETTSSALSISPDSLQSAAQLLGVSKVTVSNRLGDDSQTPVYSANGIEKFADGHVQLTPEYFANLFNTSGTASKSGGSVTLTPSSAWAVGGATDTTAIDWNKSFNLSFNYSLSGDGLGIAFYPSTQGKNMIGAAGGYLGIAGIPNAIGAKLDLVHDAGNYPDAGNFEVNGYSIPKYVPDDNDSPDQPYGTFVDTDSNGQQLLGSNSTNYYSTQSGKYALLDGQLATGNNNNQVLSTGTLTINYTNQSQGSGQLSMSFNGPNNTTSTISRTVNYDSKNSSYYLSLLGANGLFYGPNSITFNPVSYTPQQTASVKVVDTTTNSTLNSFAYSGILGGVINTSDANSYVAQLQSQGYQVTSNDLTNSVNTGATQSGNSNISLDGSTPYSDNQVHFSTDTNNVNPTYTINVSHQQKTVTTTNNVSLTINYVNNKGVAIASPSVQTKTFNQVKVYDAVTNSLVGYQVPNASTLTQDESQAWSTSGATTSAVTSPDLSNSGYINPSQTSVASYTLSPEGGNQIVNVVYANGTTIVKSTQPKTTTDKIGTTNNNYPSGVSDTNLNKSLSRVVTYVNSKGDVIAPNVVQMVNFHRNGLVDNTSGQLLAYVDDNGNALADQNAWLSNNNQLAAVNSPSLTSLGYGHPDVTSVASQMLLPTDSSQVIKVTYPDTISLVKSSNPQNSGDTIPNTSTKYQAGVSGTDLNKTVSRTINYVDSNGKTVAQSVVQTVKYHRNAVVDNVTGQVLNYVDDNGGVLSSSQGFITDNGQVVAVASPDLASLGYGKPSLNSVDSVNLAPSDANQVVTVTYPDATTLVKYDNPQTSANTIGTTNTKYPSGVSNNDLNKSISRTITYVNSKGVSIAPTVTQTIQYHRNAVVDNVTGQLLRYVDDNGNTLSDNQSFVTDNNKVASVTSPNLASLGYNSPDLSSVDAKTLLVSDSNQSVKVTYPDATTLVKYDNPQTPANTIGGTNTKYPNGVDSNALNKVVTRTINYVDSNGQTVSQPVVQTVNYHRNAIVDNVSGQLLNYVDDNGNGLTDNQSFITANNQVAKVVSPDLSDLGYQPADQAAIDAATLSASDTNQVKTVLYKDGIVHVAVNSNVQPGQKINASGTAVYPNETSQTSLQKTIKRTIHYQNENQQDIKSVVQTVSFNRIAVVNKVTGAFMGWLSTDNKSIIADGNQAWRSDQPVWNSVVSPQFADLNEYTDETVVPAKVVGDMDSDVDVYVPYKSKATSNATSSASTSDSLTSLPSSSVSTTTSKVDSHTSVSFGDTFISQVSNSSATSPVVSHVAKSKAVSSVASMTTQSSASSSTASNSTSQLPQTGGENESPLVIAGLVLLGFSSLISVTGFKRKRNE